MIKNIRELMVLCSLLLLCTCEEGIKQGNHTLPEYKTKNLVKEGTSCSNVAGKWLIEELIDASACEEGEKKVEMDTRMTQSGCKATLSIPGAIPAIAFKGVIDGKKIYLEGTYRDRGKISKELYLSIEGDKLLGTANWKYTDPTGLYTCKGTSELIARRK